MIWEKILATFLLFLPTQLGRHFWLKDSFVFGLKVDYLSPTLYFQDILILLLLLFSRRKIFSWFNRQRLIFFSLFILLLALNIFFSSTPLLSFFYWLRVVEFVLLGIMFFQNKNVVLKRLEKFLPVVMVGEFVLGVAQMLRSSSLNGIFWLLGERSFNVFTPGIARASWMGKVILRPYGTFSHPNSLAGFSLVGLILILGKKNLSWFDKLAVLAGLALILLAFSRTVWLTAFVLSLGFLLFRLKKAIEKKPSSLTFGYLSIIFFLPLCLYFFSQTSIDPTSFYVRKDLAEFALSEIREKPVLGFGGNSFIRELSQKQPVWQWLYWLQPVHNIFLLIVAETGFLGLAFFLLLLFKAVGGLFLKNFSCYPSLTVALFAILLTGLFDHYWLTLIQNQLFLVLVFSLSIAHGSARIN